MHACVSKCFCLGFAMHSYGGAFVWKLAFMHTAHSVNLHYILLNRELSILGPVALNYGNFAINGISAIYGNYHSNTAPQPIKVKKSMIVTTDCRDIINCKVTIVLCNGAQE